MPASSLRLIFNRPVPAGAIRLIVRRKNKKCRGRSTVSPLLSPKILHYVSNLGKIKKQKVKLKMAVETFSMM